MNLNGSVLNSWHTRSRKSSKGNLLWLLKIQRGKDILDSFVDFSHNPYRGGHFYKGNKVIVNVSDAIFVLCSFHILCCFAVLLHVHYYFMFYTGFAVF